MTFKPMLAGTIKDLKDIQYPVYASIKYDGIRAMMQNGRLVSRTLKPIPNILVQEKFKHLPEGADGELMYGDPASKTVFRDTTSVVMTIEKSAKDVKFYAFDFVYDNLINRPFSERLDYLRHDFFISDNKDVVTVVEQKIIRNEKQLLEFESVVLDAGFEGLIIRSADGPYKQGRSTVNQGYLLKLKRFIDAEAIVLGTFEEQENTNTATTDALGHTERSSHKAGMVGKDRLGGFEVRGINGDFKNIEFKIGSGLTGDQRDKFWPDRKALVGKIIRYKYFPIGVKDKPRLPIFQGFRDERDM